MKRIILYLLFLSFAVSNAQQQAANWYFGDNAGINFDYITEAVTPVNDGQLFTEEGCTSISSSSGNLLFYTNGVNVYNWQHSIMDNGTGLKGNQSSTQSAIIIPKPGSSNIYYIFTVDTEYSGNPDEGFHFSEVDMNLNFGLGAVTRKNQQLLFNTSEKLSAVLKDCESESIWVVTFADDNAQLPAAGENNNTFYAYEVTDTGVNPTPVISTFPFTIDERRGYLKFSPDGTKIAVANIARGLYLFDFDTDTGTVSNGYQIPIDFNFGSSQPQSPYGLEFSPNNQFLYVSTFFETPQEDFTNPNAQFGALLQYNLTAADISSTEVVLDSRQVYRTALQLGPNGKIYRSSSRTYDQGDTFLSVINDPNLAGLACNYEHAALDLGGNLSRQGLPPFIASFFNEKIDIIQNGNASTYLPLCEGDTYTLVAEELTGATYTWTQDGVIIPTPAVDPHELEVTEDGLYEVTIELLAGSCETIEGEADIEYFPNPTTTNISLIQCDEDGVPDGLTIFNLEEANEDLTGLDPVLDVVYFHTRSDAENNTDPITNNVYTNSISPETIYAQITNNLAGCSSIVEVSLEVSSTQIQDYIADSICDDIGSEDGINDFDLDIIAADIQAINSIGFPIAFYATYEDSLLEQNQLISPYTNTNPYSQIIFARAEDANACYGISEVTLTVSPLPQLLDDETVYYCLNLYPETITLQSGVDGNPNDYTYVWSNGETTNEIEVNEIGTYTVTVQNSNGCTNERTITVEASNIATIDSVVVVDGQANNTVTIQASGEGIYEYALYDSQGGVYLPFQPNNVLTNVYPGIYTLTVRDVKNNCGIVEQVISVIGFPQYFTPNGDGFHDTWQVLGVSAQFQPQTRIKIFNRYGKLLKELSPVGIGWDGTFNGEVLPNDDYWFSAKLQDGREFVSHFTLKR
ncbi:T9SS type B sorting domain-containing protein [Lacinutrix iliipiscaria]|uniref:T9SS type B sorting domain-containing protein n=1 Tax=Lacinutrix iliipiscaria TaxID=1230532 RepID=A0ABW5WPK2_9FLAO